MPKHLWHIIIGVLCLACICPIIACSGGGGDASSVVEPSAHLSDDLIHSNAPINLIPSNAPITRVVVLSGQKLVKGQTLRLLYTAYDASDNPVPVALTDATIVLADNASSNIITINGSKITGLEIGTANLKVTVNGQTSAAEAITITATKMITATREATDSTPTNAHFQFDWTKIDPQIKSARVTLQGAGANGEDIYKIILRPLIDTVVPYFLPGILPGKWISIVDLFLSDTVDITKDPAQFITRLVDVILNPNTPSPSDPGTGRGCSH